MARILCLATMEGMFVLIRLMLSSLTLTAMSPCSLPRRKEAKILFAPGGVRQNADIPDPRSSRSRRHMSGTTVVIANA